MGKRGGGRKESFEQEILRALHFHWHLRWSPGRVLALPRLVIDFDLVSCPYRWMMRCPPLISDHCLNRQRVGNRVQHEQKPVPAGRPSERFEIMK